MSTVILTPAYGRDYKNKAQVTNDWKDGKDFIIRNITDPYEGKPCSIRDTKFLKDAGYTHAQIRYARLTKLIMVKL